MHRCPVAHPSQLCLVESRGLRCGDAQTECHAGGDVDQRFLQVLITVIALCAHQQLHEHFEAAPRDLFDAEQEARVVLFRLLFVVFPHQVDAVFEVVFQVDKLFQVDDHERLLFEFFLAQVVVAIIDEPDEILQVFEDLLLAVGMKANHLVANAHLCDVWRAGEQPTGLVLMIQQCHLDVMRVMGAQDTL